MAVIALSMDGTVRSGRPLIFEEFFLYPQMSVLFVVPLISAQIKLGVILSYLKSCKSDILANISDFTL